MSAEYHESTHSQVRELIARLQSPVHDLPTLLSLLAAPLSNLGILPPRYVKHNLFPLPSHALNVSRHIPLLQRALLEHVLPAWGPALDEDKCFDLAQQYFAPDVFLISVPATKEVALHAYASILSLPLTEYSIRLLTALVKTYPVDILWSMTNSTRKSADTLSKGSVTWEDCVRNICAVPAKVANFLAAKGAAAPSNLEPGPYFTELSTRTELLVSSLTNPTQDELASITYLLTKLVNVGVFPSAVSSWHSQPSFFQATLPAIRSRIQSKPEYGSTWRQIFGSFSSIQTLQSILISLYAHLTVIDELDGASRTRALVKREAKLLKDLLGRFTKDSEIVDGFTATALGRTWSLGLARVFVCWVAGAEQGKIDGEALELLLNKIMDVWANPDHARHSLLSDHQYLTSMLLLTISYFPLNSPTPTPVNKLAMSPPFVKSIGIYISHLDHSVRRCGMLVGEEVARSAGMKLDFGDWDGDEGGKAFCRRLRELMKQRDADAGESDLAELDSAEDSPAQEPVAEEPIIELISPAAVAPARPRKPVIQTLPDGYDSDDSLTGYASEPSSSRSPSPTPSELEEIEKDPTLRVTQSKVPRPVYLAQLAEMVRPTTKVENDEDEPKRIEVALEVAEELIRRKRAYGTELEENAENLVFGFLALNDNFDLEGFDEKRQAAVTALVASCPRKAAPTIIQEFFRNQYSTDQRFVMLNALAMGARELASLPLPPNHTKAEPKKIAFPSKQLSTALHQKYLTLGDELSAGNPVQYLLDGISQKAIESGKVSAESKVPEYARERQLRMKRPLNVSEVAPNALSKDVQSTHLQPRPLVAFTEVAAEYFICPMINRFWAFLRDEQAREARTVHQPTMHRYRGAGTGLVLSALVLSHFLATLAVLVHAAQNAKEWLAVVAPDALELAVTVGTRPMSRGEGLDGDEEGESDPAERHARKEAALLTTSLELALVVIDGALSRDGGKALGLEHTALLLAAGEWGSEVLSRLEKGAKVLGGGGVQEMKLRRAAAGLVLKVDELTSRWRPSMVDMGF
ncbi:telomere length regulation protein-domain-containing protein [Phanerochaete sordida]|uniref:Telomere length regulation protein-domain-containing protein n=1 Tax=Phanerochaete sordida TaxID=48140 RepID=A0A9P3GPG4_9APHY|nr:telomere length regulation protein-domain-containing protein [Phanerochaete sordida]